MITAAEIRERAPAVLRKPDLRLESAIRLWQRNASIYRRTYRMNILPNFFEPVIYLVAMGLGLGRYLSQVQGVKYIDFIAPGLMVFAMVNMAPQAAALLAHETEMRTLERLKLSRMRTWELLLGVSLAQLVIATISIALVFATAAAFRFQPQGSVLLAFAVLLVTATATIGVGMIIASFAKRKDDAANLGVLFSVPASFLSGAFFQIPAVDLFTWNGHEIQLYDALPSTHAVRALRAVLTLGNGADSIAFALGALVVLAAVFFAIGATLFARKRMRLA